MGIGVTEDHEALRASARRFLADRCPPAVPRGYLDRPDEPALECWSELAGLGWTGLHVAADAGGGDGTLLDLAVVLEETGRACLPGPLLPTALVAAAVALADDDAVRKELLPGLADGSTTAALAVGEGLTATVDGDALVLTGELRPVLGGGLADVLLLHAHVAGAERWCVVSSDACTVTPLPSVDATRRVVAVELDRVRVEPGRLLAGVDSAAIEPYALTLAAAEAVGVAGWCLDTAVAYAKVREQFGRPIGQFQAVKHRLAELLVAVEAARAVTWDAASALSTATPADERTLAARVAALLASETAFRAATDCVQVLGGIGFTWEHDVHLYLKRAIATRALLGGPSAWRAGIAAQALDGVRRHLAVALPAEAQRYRDEVADLVASLAGLDDAARRQRLAETGYLQPHLPSPFGRGADAVEQLVVDEALAAAGIRRPHLQVGGWVVPTLIEHGTPEQQQRFVPPTLRGELKWCQLFSEPGAGSDLAALSTRAVRTDGGWLITGQKVWTSMAREADYGILLARTSTDGPKHDGITYFLLDMRAPGVDIRPLRELTGAALFNEVFLTDAFVPDDCVVGEVGGGWRLARTTLANERVQMSSGSSFGGGLEVVLATFADRFRTDPVAADAVGGLLAEAQALAVLGVRATVRAVSGGDPGAESSVRKLLGVEHEQRVQDLALTLAGDAAATLDGLGAGVVPAFLATRCLTIAGGTSEVQRNVVAERLLGLPKDP
jgi:3-oxochol-4-en-24-oyl-CoA dehydrogenase